MALRNVQPDLRIPITLHHKQLQFVTASERFLAVVTGIGWGKSYALCVRAALAAYGIVGKRHIPTPNTGVITAPTFPMLRDATLTTFMSLFEPLVADFNKAEMKAVLHNGSTILFRSASNPEKLRGPNISWWAGDEAALYTRMVFRIMIGRLRENGIAGYAFIATTPKGRDWIYQLWVAEPDKDYRLIRGRTAENYHLDGGFVESLQHEYTGDFLRQELEGEFVAFEGLIYPEFGEHTHVFRESVGLSKFKQIVAGVDWGFANPGVMLVAGVDADDRLWVLHEEYQRQQRIEEWVRIGVELRDQFRVETFYCDPADPDNINKMAEAGLPAQPADNRVLPGLQEVRRRLVRRDYGRGVDEPGLIVTGSAANLIAEFGQYQWMTNRDGLRDQPRKVNDHAVDSLRYLCMGVSGGGLFNSGGSFSTDGRDQRDRGGSFSTDGRMRRRKIS
ncbi:MAG: hypothetical protein IPM16_06825 [Chloroflexi bacterium]|nr:hypothetical protein [Chloroflexota bacterium]